MLCYFFQRNHKMSKKRKNGELPETMESLKSRNEELEAQNMTLMARIQQFEQEIRKLKENCKCPKVKKCFGVTLTFDKYKYSSSPASQ